MAQKHLKMSHKFDKIERYMKINRKDLGMVPQKHP